MKIRIERPNRLGRQMARQRIDEQISAAMEQYKGQASALRLEWLQDNPEIDRLSVAGSVYGNKVNGDVGVSEEMLMRTCRVRYFGWSKRRPLNRWSRKNWKSLGYEGTASISWGDFWSAQARLRFVEAG